MVPSTSKNAPKLHALRENPTVAMTIDTEVHPPKILPEIRWRGVSARVEAGPNLEPAGGPNLGLDLKLT